MIEGEIMGIVEASPNQLYPLESSVCVNAETLNKAVEQIKQGKELMVTALKSAGILYLLEGTYEMLAANILRIPRIKVAIMDVSNTPFWKEEGRLREVVSSISVASLYDYEAIGGFKYEMYPSEYRR